VIDTINEMQQPRIIMTARRFYARAVSLNKSLIASSHELNLDVTVTELIQLIKFQRLCNSVLMTAIQYNSFAYDTRFPAGYFLRATTEDNFFVTSITVNQKARPFRDDCFVQHFGSSESLNSDTLIMFDHGNLMYLSIQEIKMKMRNRILAPIHDCT
jgi:hypothetical protein